MLQLAHNARLLHELVALFALRLDAHRLHRDVRDAAVQRELREVDLQARARTGGGGGAATYARRARSSHLAERASADHRLNPDRLVVEDPHRAVDGAFENRLGEERRRLLRLDVVLDECGNRLLLEAE